MEKIHVKDGLYFERGFNGDVQVELVKPHTGEYDAKSVVVKAVLSAADWDAVVESLKPKGA